MTLEPRTAAVLALNRFGLGARSGSVDAIVSDVRGALLGELERPDAARLADPDLPDSGTAARAAIDFQRMQRAARQADRAARAADPKEGVQQGTPAAPARPNPAVAPNAAGTPVPQKLYLAEAKARLQAALQAPIGFAERLAWFWSNHFCVSADKMGVRPICGAYEREAIRPHVLGSFGDMLLAVEQHPAMLLYLDNARSIGPASIAGVRQKRGLNENLAREILELHTLGVRSVYSQDDVTRLANVITGWTVVPPRLDPARAGAFEFNPRMHQPSAQTILGRNYPDTGFEQGRAVLTSLAQHPATAKHIAGKLARHFVADDPAPALVEKLARRFLDSRGDLKQVAVALVTAPEAWEAPRAKLRRPAEWIVASLRAVGVSQPDIQPVMQAHNLLGEPLWRPSAPKGFSDDSSTWLDGLAERLDVANQLARRVGERIDARAVFEEVLAPIASSETRQAIARAESRPQALALLLMAPEFQRR